MKEEILVNVTPQEVRGALVENGVLQEVLIERSSSRGLISNLYLGRVSRVLPGMQAAFVDIGLARTAFLHASNIALGSGSASADEDVEPNIRDLVSEGDDLLVQVLKDPLGTKGARLTTFVTVPSRYLVYMPFGSGVGISARIEDEEERGRLKTALENVLTEDSGGYIIRTAAEGASAEALWADKLFLDRLWGSIQDTAKTAKPGDLVHEDLSLELRVLRDLMGTEMDKVSVDSAAQFDRMKSFAARFVPELEPIIELYSGRRPIFDLYGIEDEIERALERKVPLKSGGYVIFDQTEAMTTVDVNTGGYVGHRNLEETIFRTNLEAALAIARQLRLRNLGGIIIIDFIDMVEEEHRGQVLQALSQAMESDHAKSQIMDVSPLGLVEMTRKRTRESLEHQLCQPCPTCHGVGFVKSPETVCYQVFREILRQSRQFDCQELLVLAQPEVIERLLDEESASMAELEAALGKPIRLQSESLYAPDQFDVVLV